MQIRALFRSDVTRDIPPVVYFHEQSPTKLANEVSEYIVTGGWPEAHPNHRRVPNGIHEQYVKLLRAIATELDKPGGPELPAVWISGFYGSGKSSFAKLLGLALDGVALPDGTSMAEALLRRDTSPKAAEFKAAWTALRQKVEPLAVVFDIGSVARDNEHLHAATIRQLQRRLGYCTTNALVADFELKLERDGNWAPFEAAALKVLGEPWSDRRDDEFAEEDFSLVLSHLFPQHYTDPMAWILSRAGSHERLESPQEAVKALGDMLKFRRPNATLFLVVDEVSQYVMANTDRVDRLRAFATALGAGLRGRAWLLALGQQKLDEDAKSDFLVWARDRFPPQLRVHLANTNIRDVVHKRLLQKTPAAEAQLRELFDAHRADLQLFAYGCESVTADDFVEVYPMLPGHIDLLLQITSALRTRSSRVQGDDQAIRGLLQLLGELFRSQKLADMPVGALVTLDKIYEVQHTALDADMQESMNRVLGKSDLTDLMRRVAKAVALLELIQEHTPTHAKLVAACLFDRIDRGNQVGEITEALEALRQQNLIGYSEKTGYKLQSSAAEGWERERRAISVPTEVVSERVQEGLKRMLGEPSRPRLEGRDFPWAGLFSDGRGADDLTLQGAREAAAVRVDFRFLSGDERHPTQWIKRSAEEALRLRLVWVSGDRTQLIELCRSLERSRRMVKRHEPRRESLSAAEKILLAQEQNRVDDLLAALHTHVAHAWMNGQMYFRGRAIKPTDHGASFTTALESAGNSVLRDLFPHFIATQIEPSELLTLTKKDLLGISPKFLTDALGILKTDAGQHVPTCDGVVPRRVMEHVAAAGGLSGAGLLSAFGAPPYGYTSGVVKACVAGLLRGGRLKVKPEHGAEITAMRDAGVQEVFTKDRAFKKADLFPSGEDDIGVRTRAKICKLFKQHLGHAMERDNDAIADAVTQHFPKLASQLRGVLTKLGRLPGPPPTPPTLEKLEPALDQCVAGARQTKPTVALVKRQLNVLNDGIPALQRYHAELTPQAIEAVNAAHDVLEQQVAQLKAAKVNASNVEVAGQNIREQLDRDRPWDELSALDDDLTQARDAYVLEREKRLAQQGVDAEHARQRIKMREGFSTLTGEQSHHVLRPLTEALTDTNAQAVRPTLRALKTRFLEDLKAAEALANELLDDLLSKDDKPLIVRFALSRMTHNRELSSADDLDRLLKEIRDRLLPLVEDEKRVRLV